MNLSSFNPFSKNFLKGDVEVSYQNELTTVKNSQGATENEVAFGNNNKNNNLNFTNGINSSQIHFNQYFKNKKQRIQKYREMSYYPEISESLDMVSDDGILEDVEGKVISLNIRKELSNKIDRQLRDQFEYITQNIFHSKERLWDLFRKWLVEGEIFLELVLNDTGDSIIGIKNLASFNTYPVYHGDVIIRYEQYVYTDEDSNRTYVSPEDDYNSVVRFPTAQIAYINSGTFGSSKLDVRSFLDPAIRPYNQLRNLEDAVVVYRLVRAPERRVWNIETGRMTAGKKQQYIQKIINKYRKQANYNPETGAVDATQNVQSMSEDIWFSKTDGVGSDVSTIGGGQTLGELDDVRYFLNKLYKVLKAPKNRFEDVNGQYSSSSNMEREEIKFTKFVNRLQNRFKKLIMDAYIQQIKLQGFDKKLIDRNLYDIQFSKSNFFEAYKEMDVLEAKMNLWGNMQQYTVNPENPDGEFSREYVLKTMLHMTDEEWDLNEDLKKKEKEVAREEAEAIAKFDSELDDKYGEVEEGAPEAEPSNKEPEADKKKVEPKEKE